ncbi:Caspase-1, partial [Fragariocoptes setiger]
MEEVVSLSTSIDALDYNMNHPRRGLCLIFDNEKFDHPSQKLSPRTGSHVDSNALFGVFRTLDFDVRVFKDLSASAIKKQLKAYGSLDHSQSDCFACCVLTHGEHGNLYGSDGSRYPIDLLFSEFLGHKCPSLVGKPKLFFIQACQGDRFDRGVMVTGGDSLDTATYFRIPTYADFLICYSTLPGFYSWRNTQDGSWFIQALVRVLTEYSSKLDLLSMMTITSHQVAYKYTSNATTPEFSQKKQVPCITSMLTRRIYFPQKRIGNQYNNQHYIRSV